MNNNLADYIERKLLDKFIKTDEEWVDIYITPLNRIDITIVSDIADEMDKGEFRDYIRRLVFEHLVPDEGSQYSIGFLDTYNTDEADDLLLQKPENRKKQPITWSDVVSLNNKIKSKISSRDYSVICFYSYKGGVGRTTALLQVAYNLASQGKNIVLIDFDIEAPSFHLLFKKWIDDPQWGIKYGLVDYLYERMASVDPSEYKIKITDVFATIKVNETLNGNIYVVPATVKLTNQYIFKLAQLHSNVIFENDYMEEFIDALSSSLKFDAVMIDTRTGINQWGAFPLLAFADQTILIAYPNEENVEGLTNIIELMQKAGLDNYVVAMSKFEEDDRGVNIAKQYFDRFNDIKQEFLGIGYMSSEDMIGKYPFLDNLGPYKALSNYILESEIVKFNIKFLSKVNVVEILKQVKKRFSNVEESELVSVSASVPVSVKAGISMFEKEPQKEELTEEGINNLVMELLESSIFKEYIDAMMINIEIFKCLRDEKQKILDLFWGIRVSAKRYSKPVGSWFYNELININKGNKGNKVNKINKVNNHEVDRPEIDSSAAIKILNKALEIEINKRQAKEGMSVVSSVGINGETLNDRMLNAGSIQAACSWYASNMLV